MTKYFVCFAVLALIVILVTAPPVPENIGVVMFDHAQEDFEAKGLFTFKKLLITYFWVELISNELIFLGGNINFQEFIEERAKDQTKEWLLTEKERFDSELDKNKDGFLNEVEIIALAIPDNNEITTDEVNHLFAGADEYKKRKLLHEVNFTAYKVSKGFEFKLTLKKTVTQNGSLAGIYYIRGKKILFQ